jgi:signal peptidase II
MAKSIRSAAWGWFALAGVVIMLDQFIKRLILGWVAYQDTIPVTSFFNIVHVYNKGAAFSFLANAGGWQRWFFTGLAIMVSVFIIVMIWRHTSQRLFCFALALILGGAIGNVIDRVVYGYVVDFIQVHFRWLEPMFPGGYFPAFNLADSAITLGAVSLILDELLRVRKSK